MKLTYTTIEDDTFMEIQKLINYALRKIKPTIELHDKTLGIIGYGRLGKMVEKLCTPLFGKVVCVDKNNSYEKLKDIDILSIHIDLNPTTYQMINKDFTEVFFPIKKYNAEYNYIVLFFSDSKDFKKLFP